ncbi:MAG: hypothetical protein QM811_17875 [Pirellulales bacterium]
MAAAMTLIVLTVGAIGAAVLISHARDRENSANLERIAAIESEGKTKALNFLLRSLDDNLAVRPWPDGHLAKLEKLEREIGEYDPEAARTVKQRIDEQLVDLAETKLRRPKLTGDEFDALQHDLDLLAAAPRGADGRTSNGISRPATTMASGLYVDRRAVQRRGHLRQGEGGHRGK